MAVGTEKTFSLVGDLKKSTALQKTHSILSFSPNISEDEQAVIENTVLTGVTDQAVSLGGITTVTMLVIILDDQLDGTLKFKINGSDTDIPCEQMIVIFGTAITSITVSNDSGNTARYTAFMAGASA